MRAVALMAIADLKIVMGFAGWLVMLFVLMLAPALIAMRVFKQSAKWLRYVAAGAMVTVSSVAISYFVFSTFDPTMPILVSPAE